MLDSSDIPEQGLSQQRTVLSCSPLLNNQDPESMGHSCDMWLRLILVTELGYWWERGVIQMSLVSPGNLSLTCGVETSQTQETRPAHLDSCLHSSGGASLPVMDFLKGG